MDRDVFIKEGEHVALRMISYDDTDNVIKWRNNERIRQNFIYREFFTREIHENWLKTKVDTGEVVQMIICEKSKDYRPVGSVYLRYSDDRKMEAEYGIFIGEDDAVGLGYGNETAVLTVDYAKDVLGIHKLFLRAFSNNMAAIRSYEHAGFKKYKDLPLVECSDGTKSDMILMEKSLF